MSWRTTTGAAAAATLALALTASPALADGSRPAVVSQPDTIRIPADAYVIADGSITPVHDDFAQAQIPDSNGPFEGAMTHDGAMLLVVDQSGDDVLPISTPADTPDPPIKVGDNPLAITITPNDKWAFVANNHSPSSHRPYTVTPINLTTMHPARAINVHGVNPFAIIATPNGKWVFVANSSSGTVTPIRVSTRKAHKPIKVGYNPEALVVSPNGSTVWVLDNLSNEVTPIHVATRTALPPVKVGKDPTGLALTPNGRWLLVANNHSGTVTPIHTTTRHRHAAIHVGAHPNQIAVSPSGNAAYVTNWNGGPHSHDHTVIPISLPSRTAGAPISVGRQPIYLAFTASGDQLLVACFFKDKVWPINPSTNTTEHPIMVGSFPGYIVPRPG